MTILPGPNEVLGEGKGAKKLPSPDEVFTQKPINPYFEDIKNEQKLDKFNEIVERIPELQENEAKKKIFKDLALKGVRGTELSDALETLVGKHPHQEGGDKYYYNEKGIPVPLKSDERPPQGFDVANDLHGTQEEANKKGFFASAGGHIYNGIVKGVLGLEGLANLPYALATGEDADWFKSAQNRVESSLYKSPEYERENQLFDAKDMKGVEDFFDSKRYNLDANTIQGAALNGLESVTSFLVGTKGLGAVGKLAGSASEGAGLLAESGKAANLISGASKSGAMTHAFGASYAITLPEVLDYMDENGITGAEKYRLASLISVPVALTELLGGVEGQFAKNAAAKNAKSQMLRGIVDGAKKTMNPDGTMSKEALGNLYKATTSEATKLQKSFARDLVQNIGEEAGTEALQDLEKQGLSEIYDHISGEDKFKKDPLSFEAFGEYYNAALNGAAGAGGMSTAATIQKRKQEIQERQSNNIFNTVQKGPEATNALFKNIEKAVNDGEITAEQGAQSYFMVDQYTKYNQQTNGLSLKEEDKRRLFELTFEKANLESQIPTEYEIDKLGAIEQGVINSKKKQAKHLQDEVDKIFLRHDVENTTTPTAKKTKDEVAKDIENEAELKKEGAYKVAKVVEDEKRTYEEIPNDEWNKPKFFTRVKQAKFADYLDKTETKSTTGVIQQDFKDTINGRIVDTFNVTLPDGKTVRFASSMVRKPSEKEKGGFRGNTYEENLTDKENPIGSTVGVTVKTLKDSGRKVMFVWNADKSSPKYGKHIGMVKESLRGKSNYSEADLEEMADLRMENMGGGPQATEVTPSPEGPVTPKYTQPKVVLGQPTRDNLRTSWIERRKKELGSDYHPDYENVYNKLFGQQFDRLNPTLYAEEKTAKSNESDGGGTKVSNKEDSGESKTKEVRTAKPVSQRKIKNKERIKALKLEVFTPHSLIMQYFIGGGKISYEALKKFHKSTVEADSRMNMSDKMRKVKNAPTLDQLAHDLWESNRDVTPNAESQDYKNALEEVLLDYNSVIKMAEDLNNANSEKEQVAPKEEIISEMQKEAEKENLTEDVDALQDAVEEGGEENAKKIAKDQNAFDKWEEDTDIKYFDGDIQFQKSKELEFAEGELLKAEKELSASKKAFDAKRKELDKGLIEDQEDLFGERKSTDESALFDERATVDARNEAVKPFKDRFDKAQKEYKKWQDKVNSLEGTEDNQTTLFQKVSQKKQAAKDAIAKAVEVLQKAMPKMKVIYDENLKVAGYVYKDTIVINPNYAGLDTPIHEYGHVLIDSIGYDSKLIQEGIKQLKSSPLWAETKKKYPELSEEMLGKEVLAEAIGREGANVFKDITNESKFKKWLDRIFTWFKEKLGIEKNIAKKLAKQLLRGEGTAEMKGTSTQVQKQKVTESAEEIKEMPLSDLINQYWEYVNAGVKGKKFDELKKQLGYKLFQTRKQELLDSPNAEKFIEKLANTEDIGKADVLFKTLSHMSESFPELQKFSKEFENANFDMVQESNQLKAEAEKLARAVIEEKNKNLGIKERVKNLFSSDNAKYFEYLENPKATEVVDEDTDEVSFESGYWTEEQAKEKKFTKAQIDFLNFMRKLQDLRNEQYLESGNSGDIDGVLKVDKGFKEALKTGDLTEAFSAYLGNTAAIKDTELKFTDPVSGKVGLENYGDIEKKLVAYGKKGILSKLNAMRLMLKYNFQARRRSKEKFGQFSISPSGKLNNKFLKSRDKGRGYSKDFYKAALTFIDDYTHSKHIGKLLPYIDAIDAINQSGYLEHAAKPKTVEYMKHWKDLHLFKNDKPGALGPEVDAALRLLRKVTSLSVMAFNVPAAFWNTGTGIYNNIRAEGGKAQGIGLKRLLEGTNRAKFKAYNKKANDIINKYHVVSSDYDSNPKLFAGKIFDMLANGLNREAEYLIQGSMFLGQLSEADYNNLQYNDKGEIEYVGKDQNEFKEKVIKYKNRVSDIQGKYAEKDRRNYNLTEFGKSAAQFKNWLPDALKERFGAQYINADNELKAGTWNSMLGEGFQDLKKQINEKGLGKAIWENKAAMSNLKGALTVAALLSFKLGGDDDKKKRSTADKLDKALGNVLMIFDPQTLKFTVSNPIPSIGTLNRFIDAFEHAVEIDGGVKFDFTKAGKDIGKAIPYNKGARQVYDLLTEE